MPRLIAPRSASPTWTSATRGCSSIPPCRPSPDFLADHAELVEQVRQDLERGLKNPHTGRNGLTPSQACHRRPAIGLAFPPH
jgi:hypothetical protein